MSDRLRFGRAQEHGEGGNIDGGSMGAELVETKDVNPTKISGYDRVGFDSGIFKGSSTLAS
jgi:hypothetical protein